MGNENSRKKNDFPYSEIQAFLDFICDISWKSQDGEEIKKLSKKVEISINYKMKDNHKYNIIFS